MAPRVRTLPDLSLERALGPGLVICGVDEVGRGPLAGPVTAAAVILPPGGLPPELAARVNDSKALSHELREEVAPEIRAHAVAYAVAEASVAEIEELNILHASMLAMRRAVLALAVRPDAALVDGNRAPDLPCTVQCVVKGDARSQSIAAASILAKVDRDALMEALARDYPHYGWERNAGYPTPEHLEALARHGVTPHHRRKFAPVARQLALTL
jgi:ribonuclease HII